MMFDGSVTIGASDDKIAVWPRPEVGRAPVPVAVALFDGRMLIRGLEMGIAPVGSTLPEGKIPVTTGTMDDKIDGKFTRPSEAGMDPEG